MINEGANQKKARGAGVGSLENCFKTNAMSNDRRKVGVSEQYLCQFYFNDKILF